MFARLIARVDDGTEFIALDEDGIRSFVTLTHLNSHLRIGDFIYTKLKCDIQNDFYLEYQRPAEPDEISQLRSDTLHKYNHLFDDTKLDIVILR